MKHKKKYRNLIADPNYSSRWNCGIIIQTGTTLCGEIVEGRLEHFIKNVDCPKCLEAYADKIAFQKNRVSYE